MTVIKYPLCKEGSAFAAGETDFRDSCGSLIDTNGCIVLSVLSGFATATINCERHTLHKGDFILLFYGSNISVDSISAGFRIRYISVAYPLVEEAIYKPLSLQFWDMLYSNPVLHPDTEQSGLLSGWWSQMEWIDRLKDGSYKDEMLKNNIRNLLMAVDTVAYDENEGTLRSRRNHSWVLIMGFFKLLATHCHEERDVGFYADKLSITTTYLYKLCRKHMLMSPKELIDRQTISEIKSYLVNTDMPVKAIASNLNFEDVSYMCRYFRRLTGTSPVEYRQNTKNQGSPAKACAQRRCRTDASAHR